MDQIFTMTTTFDLVPKVIKTKIGEVFMCYRGPSHTARVEKRSNRKVEYHISINICSVKLFKQILQDFFCQKWEEAFFFNLRIKSSFQINMTPFLILVVLIIDKAKYARLCNRKRLTMLGNILNPLILQSSSRNCRLDHWYFWR